MTDDEFFARAREGGRESHAVALAGEILCSASNRDGSFNLIRAAQLILKEMDLVEARAQARLAPLADAWQRYQQRDLSQEEFEGTVAELVETRPYEPAKSVVLSAEAYVPADPATGDRARLVSFVKRPDPVAQNPTTLGQVWVGETRPQQIPLPPQCSVCSRTVVFGSHLSCELCEKPVCGGCASVDSHGRELCSRCLA